MASAALHIKDSYYFEVPKFMWPSERKTVGDFPDFWVEHDPDFLRWEVGQLYPTLQSMPGVEHLPSQADLLHEYEHWQHEDHANFGHTLPQFLARSSHTEWFQEKIESPEWVGKHGEWLGQWKAAQQATNRKAYVDAGHTWSKEKIEEYNQVLSGKIVLAPQPFGKLENLYERQSGFCISRFMIIELVVAVIVAAVFIWLAGKIKTGERPRGRLWNFLEVFLLFLRDEVARPAIGKHDADRFVPLLWTIFMFVLGMNLMGMVPWVGAPTGAFAVTLGMAMVTFATVVISGSMKFGVVGFWANQVPSMDLPIVLAVVIKPMLFVIEVAGLLIKHGVLGVRLLANMVAGHLVLLGIMGLAFSLEGAMSPAWPITAVISIIGSTLFSLLELFVAFLQAYIFTFLSALFIGAAVHHH